MVALVSGSALCSCAGGEGGEEAATGCLDVPVLSFDHETIDPDRGIGGGVPEVSTLSAHGRVEMITGSWVASDAALAPDGDRVVVVKADGDYESAGPQATALWVLESDGSDARELTGGDVRDDDPDWSADGSEIVFVRAAFDDVDGYAHAVATIPADGGDPVELFRVSDDRLTDPVWSPDGRRIAFVRAVHPDATGQVATTVWTMEADGTGARPLVELPHVTSLDWHPDGSSLLVGSWTSPREASLVDPDTGAAEPLAAGLAHPTWSADGDQIYAHVGVPAGSPDQWRIAAGHVEDGAFVEDRTVLDHDDLEGTAHEDIGLHPGSALDVGPCS